MSSRLMSRLARVLGLVPPGGVAKATAGAAGSNAASDSNARADRQVADDLRTITAGGAPVPAGGINCISLETVSKKLGDRWPKFKEQADQIARRTIEKRLLPADVFAPVGELSYLIVFASLTEEAARVKCSVIADEIEKRLIGESPDAAEMKITAAVRTIDRNLLETLISEGADPIPRPSQEAPAAESGADNPFDQLHAAKKPPEVPSFRPIWDVKRGAISTYLCENEHGQVRAQDLSDDESHNAEIDGILLKQVTDTLRAMLSAKRRLILGTSVHVETLGRSRTRSTYVKLCQGLLEFPDKLVIFELVGGTDGMPQSRLTEIASILKPYARAMLLRISLNQTSLSWVSNLGIFAVGAHLDMHPGSEARQIQAINRFAAIASKARILTYVHGIDTASLASSATGAGVDYVAGDAVSHATPVPGDVHRYKLADLYESHPPAAGLGDR